jgi:nucleoside 2-deoxyribosyltransferase
MIALVDGPEVEDGTSWEIGYFYAKSLPEQKIIRPDWIARSKEELLEAITNLIVTR